jgi:hypothetical protein
MSCQFFHAIVKFFGNGAVVHAFENESAKRISR